MSGCSLSWLKAAAPPAFRQEASGSGLKGIRNEAVEALVSLGYSSSEALKVLRDIEITEDSSVEDILKQALKQMAFL